MKVFKGILAAVIIIFFFVVYWFNREYFNQPHQLNILKMNVDFSTPQWPNAVFYLIIFAIGIMVTFFFDWLSKLPMKKKVKLLNRTIKEQQDKISELESELELLQAGISGGEHMMLAEEDMESEGEILYHKEGKAGAE